MGDQHKKTLDRITAVKSMNRLTQREADAAVTNDYAFFLARRLNDERESKDTTITNITKRAIEEVNAEMDRVRPAIESAIAFFNGFDDNPYAYEVRRQLRLALKKGAHIDIRPVQEPT